MQRGRPPGGRGVCCSTYPKRKLTNRDNFRHVCDGLPTLFYHSLTLKRFRVFSRAFIFRTDVLSHICLLKNKSRI